MRVSMKKDISIIIPCLNENLSIGPVLISLMEELKDIGKSYEIIVVDNGSTDGSQETSMLHGALVVTCLEKTVSSLRNYGVSISSGDLIVFIDADVLVQRGWGNELNACFDKIVKNKIITGSKCTCPQDINYLLRSWYVSIGNDRRNTHIGTGHMFISLCSFNSIGGFNPELISGEDYEFCIRAKELDYLLFTNEKLKACHLGYPNNLKEFINREIWHGLGDCLSFSTFINSKVALTSFVFLILHIIYLFSVFWGGNLYIIPVLILMLVVSVSSFKFSNIGFLETIYRNVVCYFYLLGRSLSLPVLFYEIIIKRRA